MLEKRKTVLIIVHRMRTVENADGVSGLEAECKIDLHFYNSCTTGEKSLYSYYRYRGRAHKMGQFLNDKEPSRMGPILLISRRYLKS